MLRKHLALGAILALVAAAALAVAQTAPARTDAGSLSGAGSSFVLPLVSKWTTEYTKAKINYNPVGSGAGINAITNRQVDFGASDAPLTHDQFLSAKGVVQIPWALSATSIPYNLNGVPSGLKLTGNIIADMFLGKITRWNDKQIAKINKGVKLPNEKITPIYRSDASGTTFNFTEYLSSVSSEWKRRVGKGTQVNFGTGVGAARSSGVAGTLSRTEGGITYVDVAYSLKNRFTFARVQNRAGIYARAGLRSIAAAASLIKRVPTSNELSIVNPPKSSKYRLAYPICTFTYVIVPLKTSRAADLKSFIGWAVTRGQQFGTPLLFQPIPKVVQQAAQRTLARVHA